MVKNNLIKNTPRGFSRKEKETLLQFLSRILKEKIKSLKYII